VVECRESCLETRQGRDRQSRGNGSVEIRVFEVRERDSTKEDLLSLSSNSIINQLVSSGVGQDESADLHYMPP
jgi:hypothetical protein